MIFIIPIMRHVSSAIHDRIMRTILIEIQPNPIFSIGQFNGMWHTISAYCTNDVPFIHIKRQCFHSTLLIKHFFNQCVQEASSFCNNYRLMIVESALTILPCFFIFIFLCYESRNSTWQIINIVS